MPEEHHLRERAGGFVLIPPRSNPLPAVREARQFRALTRLLEVGLATLVVGSVLAFGSVHPWARVPVWVMALALGVLFVARVLTARSLRRQLGAQRFVLDPLGASVRQDDLAAYGPRGWVFDLSRPLMPRPPLLIPGVVFAAWVVVQLVPLPPGFRPITASPTDTAYGLAFVAAFIVTHIVAASLFQSSRLRRRFLWVLAGLSVALALVTLGQQALGLTRIYGFFQPWESASFFGPFVNRNHLAAYMLLLLPACLSLVASAYRGYSERVGRMSATRRRIALLLGPDGIPVLYACVPALAAVAALVASTSRGGIIAATAGLALAALGLRRNGGVPVWAMGAVFAAMALSWFGLERIELRFGNALDAAPARASVWKDALSHMEGLWLTGSGFNTYGHQMGRAAAWALPGGATPWPERLRPLVEGGRHHGYRSPSGLPARVWYREAHNDYVQVLYETGVPGLAIALWGAVAALAAARRDPWLLAAVAGILMHEFVEFGLQVPAVAILLAALAARATAARSSGGRVHAGGSAPSL